MTGPGHLLPCTRCNGSGSEPTTSPEPPYRPDQLLAARHDTPDQTGPLVDWEPEPVPAQAITETALDAAMAVAPDRHRGFPGGWEPALNRHEMRIVLEAAAPHLAAVERERYAVVKDAADAYAQKAADLHRENLHLRDENVALRQQLTEAENLRHALKEAGKEMDRRYEMGVAAGRAACVRHLRTITAADLLDRHGLERSAGAHHVLAAAASELQRGEQP